MSLESNDSENINEPGRDTVSFRVRAAAFLFFLLLSCVLTYPVVLSPGDYTFGLKDHIAPMQEYFLQANMIRAWCAGDPIHYYRTDFLNHPYGQDIGDCVGISLNLFFYIPLAFIDNVFARTNLLIILILTLNGFFMFRLLLKQGRPAWTAVAGGFFFVFSPYLFLKLNQGFIQKIILFWIPLFWGALSDLEKKGRIRDGLKSGLMLSCMLYSYAPYAYFLAVIAGLRIPLHAPRKDSLVKTMTALAAAILLPVLAAILLQTVVREPFLSTGAGKHSLDFGFLVGVLDISRPFRFWPYSHFTMLDIPLPLGITVLLPVLSFAGFFLDRRGRSTVFEACAALFFLLMAMGDNLAFGDQVVRIFGLAVPLPYRFFTWLPFGDRLGFPIRALPVAGFFMTILSVKGISALSERIGAKERWMAVAACILLTADNMLLLPELFPMQVHKANAPEFFLNLRNEEEAAFLNLPPSSFPRDNRYAHYVYYAAVSGWKIVNPYRYRTRKIEKSMVYDFPGSRAPAAVKAAYLDDLSAADVRYIVIHTGLAEDPVKSVYATGWLADFLGEPTTHEGGDFIVYDLSNLAAEKLPTSGVLLKSRG